jgi:hypothetical protein
LKCIVNIGIHHKDDMQVDVSLGRETAYCLIINVTERRVVLGKNSIDTQECSSYTPTAKKQCLINQFN